MDFLMIGLFIMMPILMIGLIKWSGKVVEQESDA